MIDKYRVTVPECYTDFDPQAHTDVTHTVRTVLWQGNSVPDESVIDKLLEGQTERAQYGPTESSTYLNIEKKRRMNLGWFVVDRVNIPGA